MTGAPQTAQALFRAENRIFQTWRERSPTLLRDGALGGRESTYLTAPVRVLFVLKEPNDTGERWSGNGADLRLHTRAFADLRSTFPVLLLLAVLAQSPGLSLAFSEARELLRERATRVRLLRSIALVNLKKTPGGAVCKDRTLVQAVSQDGDLLEQQLALYRPHLTIAGGSAVFALLANLFGGSPVPSQNNMGRPAFTDRQLGLCLSFFHPQATKGFQYLFELLRESLDLLGFAASRHASP